VPKPVVMAVNGIAFTLSIELALAADIVIAADDVRFRQLEIGAAACRSAEGEDHPVGAGARIAPLDLRNLGRRAAPRQPLAGQVPV
jgi:hypothetical protein